VLIDTDPLHGPAAQAVTESGAGAQMLVLGSRGIGAFTTLLLGSVSRYAASHASCPVVVVRDEAPSPHGLVGVGVADLDTCGDALTFAFEEASLRKAGLLVVHAWHTPQTDISRAGQAFTPPGPQADAADAARHLTGLLDDWRAKYPDVQVSQDVVHGHPGRRAGRPVRPRRPGGRRPAREAPRAAGRRLGPARRAEPRARPRGHHPLGLDERCPGRRPAMNMKRIVAATDGSYPVGQMRVPARPDSRASASASRPMAAGLPVASVNRHTASILGPIDPAGKSCFRSSAGVARRIGRACGVP
jgi:hypothetical protein